jgi:putative transposase
MSSLLQPLHLLLMMFSGWVNRHQLDLITPNLNAFAERFVRSLKSECLNRMIFFGRDSLQHAISQFMSHYHAERNHQGLENRLLHPAPAIMPSQPVRQRQRLGGMLNYYYRAAA